MIRTITIPCDLLTKSGREAREGVPFMWLESWLKHLRASIPDEEEGSCVVTGVEHLVASYGHRLSPLEKAQVERDEVVALLEQLRRLQPAPGQPWSEEALASIGRLLATRP